MEELIHRELHRLVTLNLKPSYILIDMLEWEYLRIRTASMFRMYGSKIPSQVGNSFAGLKVIPVSQLEGGFQVAVHNHTVRGSL